MPEVTKYDQGTPSWVDLATTDVHAADAFYGSLFGWKADHQPAGEDMIYSMQTLKGKSAAGIYLMNEDQKKQGMPPHWATYITVDDAQKVMPFYKQVLNVDFGRMEGVDMEYWLLRVGGRDVGGVMPKNEQMKSLPSHWSVYFAVDDCDGTVDKAKSMNAQMIVPPTDMGPGRFAVLQDPQGAVFSVIKMEQPAA